VTGFILDDPVGVLSRQFPFRWVLVVNSRLKCLLGIFFNNCLGTNL